MISAPVLALALALAAPQSADTFPHAAHRRLFTSCDACHAGIAAGDSSTRLPAPQLCAGCHDGETRPRVDWQPGPPRPTNLSFAHEPHPPIGCESCHATSETAELMDVGRAEPATCLPCHAPDAAEHLQQTECAPCHGPLRDAVRLTAARIARFPRPPSHDSSWFFAHPAQAGSPVCATCHARDFCASCHVNAGRVEAIQALQPDERVAGLMRDRRTVYRAPDTHRDTRFWRGHGLAAEASVRSCGACHARESCLTCHRPEERVAPVSRLPRRGPGGAEGVDLSHIRPPDHTPGFHRVRHRTAGSGGDATCGRCHAPSFCASCHDASRASVDFHPANFLERHGQAAFTRDVECASCHQTQAFCTACHRQLGATSTGAPYGRFHNAAGVWFLGHGAAARRSLEACTSCHSQQFCMRCHSASGAIRVNPHGPGFSPGMGDKNPAMCRMCHPGGRPGP